MKKITGPLFKWFGSKWLASRLYPQPQHNQIFEPFAGSAGYSLRHVEREVIIFENDPLLSELWAWLISEANTDLIMSIPLGTTVGADIREMGLTRGQQLLLKNWQRTNNVGNCWTISPWGNKPGQWTASTRKRVAEEVNHIKHWQFRPIEFNKIGTYFIDPPYLYNYRYRQSGFDHKGLAVKIRGLPRASEIIACEALCPISGAAPNYLPFENFGSRVTSRRKAGQHHHSNELVYHAIL